MARVPEPETTRRRRWRVPRVLERPTRTAFLVLLVIVAAVAADWWVRAIAVAVSLGIFYAAGWADGRRDGILGLVRGDARAARRATGGGADAGVG